MSACQALVGLYDLPVEESLAGARGCPDEATVTLRGACAHEHVAERSYCELHGQVEPQDGVWLCLACARAGHSCRMHVEAVTA